MGVLVASGIACSDPTTAVTRNDDVGEVMSGVSSGTTDLCAPTPAAQASNGDTRYYRYSSAKTWNAAKADCVAMGGRLAVPTSSTTNGIIRGANGNAAMYIGLTQSSGQTSPGAGWTTFEGDTLTYTNWKSGEPNDYPTAGENGQEDCGQMNPDGTWNDVPCAGPTGQYACEFGSAPVACGGGSSCGVASGDTTYRCHCPSGQKFDPSSNTCYGGALTVEVNSLSVDHLAAGNVYVNFPIHGTIGLKGTGNTNNVSISLGLMEKPPSGANATDEELASLRSCVVGHGRVTLSGNGSQQYLDVDGIVPPECLGTDPQRNANFFVLVDAAEENTTETNKWLVFNAKDASKPVNQKCTALDPVTNQPIVGCVLNVAIKPPPGLDIALLAADPTSSVGVLAPATQPSDIKPGHSEPERPLLVVNAKVAAYGRDDDTTNGASLPGNVDFAYDIIAQPDNANVGWKPLNVNPDAQHAALSSITPGEALQLDARLHATTALRNLLAPGGAWASATSFQVRACANVPFTEVGDPSVGGADGKSNNCKTFSVTIVPGDHATSSASSYDVSSTYSGSFGSSSTLKLSLTAGSTNSFAVSTGASSQTSATATVSGFFGSVDVFSAWGDAYAKITSASLDAGFKIFGVSLLDYTKSVSATYTKNYSVSKEKCLTYTYGVIVDVEIEGCFEATAGVDVTLTANSTSVSAQVRPYASASLSVSASLDLVIYKASLSASVTLLGLDTSSGDGVTGTLSFSVSGSQMTISFDVTATVRVTTLSGSIKVTLEELEADWCKKKVWGVTVHYVCWEWDTIASYTLFSYSGYSFTKTLIDRTLTSYTLSL
jgi:hypothetical protein